jgi:hypothetical protein
MEQMMEPLPAEIKANREEMKADQREMKTEMKAVIKTRIGSLPYRMDSIPEEVRCMRKRMDSDLREMKAKMDVNEEKVDAGKGEMKSTLTTCREVTDACLQKTEAGREQIMAYQKELEANPEGYHEVHKGVTYNETIQATED